MTDVTEWLLDPEVAYLNQGAFGALPRSVWDAATELRLQMEPLTDFHLALPESESFLAADLSKDAAAELAYAEQAH